MPLASPIPLLQWIDAHREQLRPPIGALRIYEDASTIIMAVGGPNSRNDYHIDPGEELFFQLEGTLTLRVVEDGEFREVLVRPGELFLLPAGIPHCPCRPTNSIGLVVERQRTPDEEDGVRWYCESCRGVVREVWFREAEGGFLPLLNAAVERWRTDAETRRCPTCGHVNPVPAPFESDAT
jgi:3-hydroxyanthranilate 3,4-dioxygenase